MPQNEDQRLYGFVRWIAKAGKEEALRQELLKLVPNARKDPGNISYDLFTPPDQPAMTYLFEVWTDRASVEAHAKQPYVQEMIASVPDLLAEPYTAILTGMLSAADAPPGHSVVPGSNRT